MLYPTNFEQKIGFDKIRILLKNLCISDLAKSEIDKLTFSSQIDTLVAQLTPIDEMMHLLADGTDLPLGETADLHEAFARTHIAGTFLEPNEIDCLRRNVLMAQQITTFLAQCDTQRFPALHRLSLRTTADFSDIRRTIDALLDKFGEIKDNASPELAQIRHDIHRTQASVSRTLNAILRQAQSDGLIEKDATPTMRDGRLVIPIPAMNKRKLGGIVHDESATGKTAFVEPSAIVETNNRLRELESAERREIIRILVNFTDFARPYYPELLDTTQFLAEIDALQAKARFANKIEATKPYLKSTPDINWHDARHPLLQISLENQGKSIVPLTIRLNTRQRILLISGPNAGGKSVCLKTVGLLQYMLQCGLPIPVNERSEAGIFEHLFIDIGDEQSIENDLSTYSSHLLNMKQCLKRCNPHSLLLIDEFGTGTEPQIGGALAEALLEKFNTSGTFGVITTHYTNLKHFAASTEGIANGAMLYDRHQMQPLFSLQIGQPGSSFAVEIARKIGLPEDVILSATEKIGAEHINYDKNLQDAARDKHYWELKRQKIREKEKHLDTLTHTYEQELNDLKRKQKEVMRQAKTDAAELVAQANARIEQTIRRIKETQADKAETQIARQQLTKFKNTLREKSTTKTAKKQLKIGDNVCITGQQITGKILEINEKNAIVIFGQLKSTVAVEKLEPANANQPKPSRQAPSSNAADNIHARQLHFKPEIDVRGMRVDEAQTAVMYFIDDAQMLGVGRVRILHGTGTGALRQAIRDYLHNVSAVKSYHDEHVQFGGAGITVVEMC